MTFSQKRTILIVDDEDLIRELLADALSDDFKVLAARNGEEALTLFEQHKDEIALVITDLIMPKMRGDALAERVRELRPTLPIIFISGYERGIETNLLLAKGRAAFLPKPFDVEKLISTMQAVLV
jgi:two-component system cell cycle sensor histidine kinase/response regulator CckA